MFEIDGVLLAIEKIVNTFIDPQTSSNADSNNKLWPSTNFPVAQSSSICDRLLPSIVAIENQNRGKFESPPGSTSNFD